MGDSVLLGANYVISFVDPAEQNLAEVNGPDPVVDLLEPDWVLLERVGKKEQPLPQAEGAGVGDALDEKVPRVLDRRQRAGVAPRRRPVRRRGRPTAESFVRALFIVKVAEGIEGPLLGGAARVRGRHASRFSVRCIR